MHKSQIFFWSLIAFISGVFLASFFEISHSGILVLTIGAISILGISAYQGTYSRRGILAGVLSLVFIFGIVRFNSFNFSNSILSQFADREAGGKGAAVLLKGYVDEEPDIDGDKTQLVFRAKEIIVREKTIKINERTLVRTNSFPRYKFGDELSVSGSLKTPQNFSENFDYITYLKKQNVGTIVSFPKISEADLELETPESAKVGLYKRIFGIKDKFESAINGSVAEPNASFLNGILLGSRQNIPEKLKEAFNQTGTTHILAISGYNIMIISWAVLAGLIYFFKRRTAFWISVAVIILFTILTGSSASVVRASVMGLLLLFAHGYGRLYNSKNSIILAGAAMIFFNPLVLVFDIGFQLSFLAVLGLLYLYPFFDNKLQKIPNMGGIKELALMTVSAQLTVLPLLFYYFHQFSLLSLPANILILPFVPVAMLLGFLSGVGGIIFPPLGVLIGYSAWAVTTYQIEVVKFLGSIII